MRMQNGLRSSCQSLSPDHSVERERSREKKNKVQYYIGPDLHLTKHYYFVTKDQKNIGYAHAVWNFCMTYGRRPAICLIICQSETKIQEILNLNKLSRRLFILADKDRKSIKDLVQKDQAQIVMLTAKKASMIYAIDEAIPNFNLIVNVGFHKDLDNYRKLHQFIVKTGGILISFITHRRDLQKIEEGVGINFTQLNGNIGDEDINKQILSTIQFLPTPKPQTLSILKLLPFSHEEISARMFELLKNKYSQIEKSKYLGLAGYVTYQLKTEVEFNSYKYIWNFLKDTLPEDICDNVRNMIKFKDGKGAIFNLPVQNKNEMDRILRKLRKHSNEKSKFQISIVHQLPQIQDIESQQYKLAQQKKAYAMRNKSELQIFVGGLPMKAGQHDIRTFFLQNNVNPLTIRLMKDRDGRPRGICFILCEDEEHLKRALNLDETKFQDRTIRVHIAQKRERRRDD